MIEQEKVTERPAIDMASLPKAYEPQDVETKLYRFWDTSSPARIPPASHL